MKRLLFSIVLLMVVIQMWGKQVSRQTAMLAAERFALTQRIPIDQTPVVSIETEGLFSQMYVFGFSGAKGFVIIAADDRVVPVLGYSLTTQFSASDVPVHVSEWLADYESQINWLIANNVEPSAEVQRQWDELTGDGSVLMRAMTTAVGPLMTTTWNQTPYYNNSCPYDGSSRSVTGCVATATAQVMKYWNHPTTGHGSNSYTWNSQTLSANFGNTTYQWSNMPNSLTSSSTSAQKNAVATLMYHVGVALEMDYGASESSSSTYTEQGMGVSAELILQSYFKYSNNIRNVFYSDMTDAQWKSTLKNELDNGRVMLYSGRDSGGGHCFVCDGYNSSSYFHFNWGWGGLYDGYFAIGALNPGAGGTGSTATNTFNLKNVAVIGIQPITGTVPSTTTATVTSANTAQGTVVGSGTYNQYDTIAFEATANEGYLFDRWDDNDRTNPRFAFATSSTFNRTAYFKALPTDTMRYCADEFTSATNLVSQWGIRYPASALVANRLLKAVQVNLYEQGQFTLIICQGDDSQMTQVYSQQFTPTAQMSWTTVQLSTPYPIDNTKSLWITLSYSGSGYPMAYSSFYGGNSNGMMLNYGGDWLSYNDYGVYGSWLIKGITEQVATPTQYYNVTASAIGGGAVSPSSARVAADSVVTLTAQAYSYYRFVRWSDGVTAYKRNVTVESDTAFTALFESIGMDTVAYCSRDLLTNLGLSSSTTLVWGVRYHQGSPMQNSTLTGISYYCGMQTTTTITALVISGTTPNTLLSQFSFTPAANSGWQTYNLPTPVSCGDSAIWILLAANAAYYPASASPYTANVEGTWISLDGGSTLNSLLNYGNEGSWMIRAVVTPPQAVEVPYTSRSNRYYSADNDYYITLSNSNYNFYFDVYCMTGEQNIRDGQTYSIYDMMQNYSYLRDKTASQDRGYQFASLVRNNGSYEAYVTDYNGVRYHVYEYVAPIDTFTVTAMPNNAAMGSVTGGGIYLEGDTATLTATANANYHFVSWSNGATTPTINVVVTKDTTLTATFAIDTHNVTVNVNNPAMGSVTGGGSFNHGATATLTATANANYHFVSWSNGATTPTINVVVTKDTTLTATFAIDTHNVTVNVNNPAMGSVTGGGSFNHGATATLTATANANYHFVSWSNGATTPTINVVVTKDTTLTATFAIDTHNVTVNVNNPAMGSVTGGGSFNHGATATLTATPNTNYHFVSWSNGATTPTINVVVTKDTTLTATFAIDTHNVTVNVNNSAMGSVTGGGSFNHGATATLTATANANYHFVSWSNGATTPTINVVVTKDTTLTATFAIDTHNVTVNVNNPAMGSVTGGGSFNHGATATLTATANANYHFVSWSNGATTSTINVVVTKDTTLTATFAIDTHNVTVNVNDPAMGSVTGGGLFNHGATATLTATANTNYHFVSWNNGATTTTINITVTKDTVLTATFAVNAPDQFAVTANVNDPAMGSVTGGGTYSTGATATLTATANANYHFVSWSNGATTPTINVVVTKDTTLTATFAIDTHNVTVNVNDPAMGSVTGGGSFNHGATATLTATANANYHFVSWSNGATTPTINVVVTKDTTLTATFAIDTHNVTVNVNDPAMGSVTGGGSFNHGATATLTATATANYHFVSWSNGATTPTINVVVTKDTTLTATFAIDTHNVTVNVNNPAMGSVTGGGSFTHGATATLTATANANYHFVSWSNGATTPTINVVVTKDTTLTATFAIDTHNVTVNVNDPAMGSVTGGGSFNHGATATLTATANANYHFVSWSNGATTPTINVVVTKDTTLTATFALSQSYLFETDTAICQGDSYSWRSQQYTISGVYYDSLTTIYGADSVYKLTLTVNPTYYFYENQTICSEPILWHGQTIYDEGIYYDNLVTSTGCDSIYELTVTRNEFTVTVNVNDAEMGTVTGDGTYQCGDTAMITAIPNDGYQFVNWSNGETSAIIYVVVVSDTTLTANFESITTGVSEAETSLVSVVCNDNVISIYGATDRGVRVYDATGKMVAVIDNATEYETIHLYVAGIYFVKVDNGQDFKVVVK